MKKRVTTKTKKATAAAGFVLGARAFKSISAVEGVKLSKRMAADLAGAKRLSPAKKRSALLAKYGKKSK